MFPVIMLAINTVIYLLTVAMSAGLYIFYEAGRVDTSSPFENILIAMLYANQALSLLTNIFATSIITIKAWKYRKTLITIGIGIRAPTRAIRILGLVIESGMLYIFIGVVTLISPAIQLPFGALGDIFMPVAMQLAGMYPIIVLLLVENNRSLDTTYFSSSPIIDVHDGDQCSRMEPIGLAAGPVLVATGSQIEIATKPPNIDVHISFGSALEPGDSETGAESDKSAREYLAVTP